MLMVYQSMIFKYAPFLNKKMFDMFENLRQLCSQQIRVCYTDDLVNPGKYLLLKMILFKGQLRSKSFMKKLSHN